MYKSISFNLIHFNQNFVEENSLEGNMDKVKYFITLKRSKVNIFHLSFYHVM